MGGRSTSCTSAIRAESNVSIGSNRGTGNGALRIEAGNSASGTGWLQTSVTSSFKHATRQTQHTMRGESDVHHRWTAQAIAMAIPPCQEAHTIALVHASANSYQAGIMLPPFLALRGA